MAYMCKCVYLNISSGVCWYPKRPKEDVGFPAAGVIGGCEQPNTKARNQILVIHKNSKLS